MFLLTQQTAHHFVLQAKHMILSHLHFFINICMQIHLQINISKNQFIVVHIYLKNYIISYRKNLCDHTSNVDNMYNDGLRFRVWWS